MWHLWPRPPPPGNTPSLKMLHICGIMLPLSLISWFCKRTEGTRRLLLETHLGPGSSFLFVSLYKLCQLKSDLSSLPLVLSSSLQSSPSLTHTSRNTYIECFRVHIYSYILISLIMGVSLRCQMIFVETEAPLRWVNKKRIKTMKERLKTRLTHRLEGFLDSRLFFFLMNRRLLLMHLITRVAHYKEVAFVQSGSCHDPDADLALQGRKSSLYQSWIQLDNKKI